LDDNFGNDLGNIFVMIYKKKLWFCDDFDNDFGDDFGHEFGNNCGDNWKLNFCQ
jgi:hypothetical protein